VANKIFLIPYLLFLLTFASCNSGEKNAEDNTEIKNDIIDTVQADVDSPKEKESKPVYKVLDVSCYECSECTFTVIDRQGKKLKLNWELMSWMVGTGETSPCYDEFIEKFEGKDCFKSAI